MKLYKNFIIFALLTISSLSFGQAQIKGIVYTPQNEPSEYSTVVLMNQDSVFMNGTLSGPDGTFLFDKLGSGTYHIMVRNVEFNTHVSESIVLESSTMYTMEPVHLEARLNDLDEVVIKGEKAMVEVHPDKMVFNVANSANSTGNNALELLSKSPGVMVDMDKNIILQGKSGVQIYINGRPSRISGSDLTNMLEGMQAENIESIEIISNPSAKYDAEGSGGIINIILKENIDAGFNGNLIGSYSKGLQGRTSVGTSLNYSRKKLNFFSSLNVSENDYLQERNEEMLRQDFLLDMESENVNKQRGINFAGGMDYKINKEHSLSLDARVLVNDRDNNLGSYTGIFDVANILDPEMLVAETLDDGANENYNANLHYSFVPNRSSSLSADVSFGTYSSRLNTEQPNGYYDIDQTILLRSVESEYDRDTDINLFSSQVDYEKKISNFTFSTGAKYSYISTNNSLAFYNIQSSSPVLDVNRSNDFSYLEQVAAAYFIVNAKPAERISLNAGIRVENTSSLGELVSATPGPDDVVARNYTSLFPNFSVSYSDDENHALSLSYGRRITRPNYQDLNPFEAKMSELAAWKGNPFLEPNYISNYQLTYSFKRKLVISNTYSVTNNFFANIFEVVGDKGNVIIPRNMDKVTNNGLSVSYPQKVFEWWQFSTFLVYNYSSYGGNIEGTIIDLDQHTVNVRMQNNIKLPLDITMELSYYYTSPWIWRGTVTVEGNHNMNLGLRREFMNERLLLQVSVRDPFNTGSIYYYNSDYGGMIVDGNIFFDSRRVGFSGTFKFGNQQAKNRQRNSAIDAELQRISD
ncbi:TonB-dependent receptor domain-containing protein [Bacteroidota bacterium]